MSSFIDPKIMVVRHVQQVKSCNKHERSNQPERKLTIALKLCHLSWCLEKIFRSETIFLLIIVETRVKGVRDFEEMYIFFMIFKLCFGAKYAIESFRGCNCVHFIYIPQCTVTLNSNFAIFKPEIRVKELIFFKAFS